MSRTCLSEDYPSTPLKIPRLQTSYDNQHNITISCNGKWYANEHPLHWLLLLLLMIYLQLSKEDEAAAGRDKIKVCKEDQDKINKFSQIH